MSFSIEDDRTFGVSLLGLLLGSKAEDGENLSQKVRGHGEMC